MICEIENNRTQIISASVWELHVIDLELRYPTQFADVRDGGFKPPGDYGGWDGWIRFLHKPKHGHPWFPTGLLPRVLNLGAKMQFPIQATDKRLRTEPGVPEWASEPIVDRDYQLAAVAAGEQAGRGVLDMVPRCGKSRIGIELQRRLALPTLWMAPTDRIVRQTVSVFERFMGKNYAVQQVGSKGAPEGVPVVCCTAATAIRLPQEFMDTRQVVFVDELHHSAASSYHKIFAKLTHVYYRFGMTGTFFRSGEDELALHAVLSNVIYKITSQEMLDRGFLVPTDVVFVPITGPKVRGVPQTFTAGHGKFGIHEHDYRNRVVAQISLFLAEKGKRVLVLVGTKKQGRWLAKVMREDLLRVERAEFEAVEFVSADMPRPIQAKILDSFNAQQEVRILIGTSILGEGVDLPPADALVYARGEKAEVSLTQNMYRVCTAMPGKHYSLIVDFADRHHRKLLEHTKERAAVYFNEPTFTVFPLESADQFEWWYNHRYANYACDLEGDAV